MRNDLFLESNVKGESFTSQIKELFEHQIQNWKLASDNYRGLESVQVKKFEFDGFEIEAHFNPGRIISSSAKVDAKTIKERPCFLCLQNLPPEQKAVQANEDYIILVNPFPIFPEHFTIPLVKHLPQLIKNDFKNLLFLTEKIGKEYTLFYNGPRCGASAPDHMHFQAGSKNFMKIDSEYTNITKRFGEVVYEENELKVHCVTGYLRNFFSIDSSNSKRLVETFNKIFNVLPVGEEEPMMNIICSYNEGVASEQGKWRVIIFPRSKHRPSLYFEEGQKQILISPAAVDLGGVCIFPREEDFDKIEKDLLIDVFRQVTLGDEEIKKVSDKLKDLVRV